MSRSSSVGVSPPSRGQLQGDAVGDAVLMRADEGVDAVDALVEDEGMRTLVADRAAFLVGGAGLFERDVEIFRVLEEPARLARCPRPVGVGEGRRIVGSTASRMAASRRTSSKGSPPTFACRRRYPACA